MAMKEMAARQHKKIHHKKMRRRFLYFLIWFYDSFWKGMVWGEGGGGEKGKFLSLIIIFRGFSFGCFINSWTQRWWNVLRTWYLLKSFRIFECLVNSPYNYEKKKKERKINQGIHHRYFCESFFGKGSVGGGGREVINEGNILPRESSLI